MFYGAAEVSRDLDIAVLAEPDNLDRLRAALTDLQARPIAVPPFELNFLPVATPSTSDAATPRRRK